MPIAPIGPIAPTIGASPVAAPATPTAGGFADVLSGAVDQVQATQGASDTLALKAVTGDLSDIHDATIAAARADVTMQLAATIRNKGVDAFNEIMRMQA
jgi:flagellar hook-basal body complex protein FliE